MVGLSDLRELGPLRQVQRERIGRLGRGREYRKASGQKGKHVFVEFIGTGRGSMSCKEKGLVTYLGVMYDVKGRKRECARGA